MWVKTSLAPGSKRQADYLKAAGLQDDLDALGYQLVFQAAPSASAATPSAAAEISKPSTPTI